MFIFSPVILYNFDVKLFKLINFELYQLDSNSRKLFYNNLKDQKLTVSKCKWNNDENFIYLNLNICNICTKYLHQIISLFMDKLKLMQNGRIIRNFHIYIKNIKKVQINPLKNRKIFESPKQLGNFYFLQMYIHTNAELVL